MDGDLRRADLHLERHPRVPFNGDRTQPPCAPMPRRSIGLPTKSLKQHRAAVRRDRSGSGATNCAPGGWSKAPSEATHVQDYSTAHDAYDSGVRAADEAITALT
jgi:hypothetical protein